MICYRIRPAGERLAEELRDQGPGTCDFVQCDVTQPPQITRVIEETVVRHSRLDCLINNAGWHPDKRTIDDFSVEEFEDLLRLNLVSYFAACKLALPYLRETRGGIINISSLVGTNGQEWATTCVATKGGISALTKAPAIDEARHGVRVNAVLPEVIHTPGTEAFIQLAQSPQAHREYLASWQWAGRMGTPLEVGYVCRGEWSVIVLDRDRRYLDCWAQGQIVRAHGMTIGPDDMVYCVDDRGHAVRKFTPDGKLLTTIETTDRPAETGYELNRPDTVLRSGPPFNRPTDVAVSPTGEPLTTTVRLGRYCPMPRGRGLTCYMPALRSSWSHHGTSTPSNGSSPYVAHKRCSRTWPMADRKFCSYGTWCTSPS